VESELDKLGIVPSWEMAPCSHYCSKAEGLDAVNRTTQEIFWFLDVLNRRAKMVHPVWEARGQDGRSGGVRRSNECERFPAENSANQNLAGGSTPSACSPLQSRRLSSWLDPRTTNSI
jgi:hypothetical protein